MERRGAWGSASACSCGGAAAAVADGARDKPGCPKAQGKLRGASLARCRARQGLARLYSAARRASAATECWMARVGAISRPQAHRKRTPGGPACCFAASRAAADAGGRPRTAITTTADARARARVRRRAALYGAAERRRRSPLQ